MVDIILLQYIIHQVNIYSGLFVFILGMIGETLNIIIFANVRTAFAQNPCSLYFIAMSVTDLLCLVFGLLTKILANDFGIDPTVSSIAFCKFRSYLVYTAPLISTAFTCLATITQSFATSRLIHHRQKINLRFIRWSIVITVLFWCLHGIPHAVLYNIYQSSTTNTSAFSSVNSILNLYTSWMTYNLLIFIISTLILIVFGYLTYKNVVLPNFVPSNQPNTVGQRIQRQLTIVSDTLCSFIYFSLLLLKLLLTQIVFMIVTSSPSRIYNLYASLTTSQIKTIERKSIEQLVSTLLTCIFYANYAGK